MKRVCVVASASGSGKTTFGRALARRLGLPFHELDALNHGPGWVEATAAELRARVEPLVAADEWVIDGAYRGKLGDLILGRADALIPIAWRSFAARRRRYPTELGAYPVVRLRTRRAVARFLATATPGAVTPPFLE